MSWYQNRYRRQSTRLNSWDYRRSAAYFVTICTKDRKHYLGDIVDNKMVLSNTGVIADVLWDEIRNYNRCVKLDVYVIMPNHIHGIIILNSNLITNGHINNGLSSKSEQLSSETHKNEYMSEISPKANSLSAIIRSYKSAVTKHANRLGYDNGWQPRFYDHIIKSGRAFNNIRNYIINNPKNWKSDKFGD